MSLTSCLATVMSGFLYYLLKSPDKMEILLKEIRGRFTNADEISFESAAELKYLNTCVKETLRIYPPAPIGSPRVVSPGGQQILGKYIPAETRVSVHHWS